MTIRCASCGASLEDKAAQCQYCGSVVATVSEPSPTERETWAKEAHKTGRYALIWSLVGLAFCCALIPSAVGLMQALRSRNQAQKAQIALPATTVAALAISSCWALLFLGFAIFFALESRAIEARKALLKTELADRQHQPTLDSSTACKLVELHLLEEGYQGTTAFGITAFDCNGEVATSSTTVGLPGIRFKISSKDWVETAACFERGQRWRVKALDCASSL